MGADAHTDDVPSPVPDPPVRRRTAAHAWAETRGLLGGHVGSRRTVRLHTSDGLRLTGTLLPGPRPAVGPGPAVLLLHGFNAHHRKPRYAWLADELATRMTVLAVDLRGHGASDGHSGLGADEHLDVEVAVDHLRALGHEWVAIVGVSMGATSAAHAAVHGVRREATVLISGPGWIDLVPTTEPMQRLGRIWRTPGGRSLLRAVTGVRVRPPGAWTPPPDPRDAVRSLDGPLLVVHGTDDAYFPPAHAHAVAAAADGVLWEEPVFGHAEDGFHGTFGRRLAHALLDVHRTGRFPEREAVPWLG